MNGPLIFPTPQQIAKIAPRCPNPTLVAQLLYTTMAPQNMLSINRAAAFIGQLCLESQEFNKTLEDGNGAIYEGRRDLGNIVPGDGPKYRGRGYLQITGRNNYTALSRAINIDLVNYPNLLCNPDLAMSGSIWWWINRLPNNGMNLLADAWNVQQITRMVNGGYNDLQARIVYSNRAQQILGSI